MIVIEKSLQGGNTVNIGVNSKRWGRTSSNLIASTDTKKTEFGNLEMRNQPDL